MCLAIPGQVQEIFEEHGIRMGRLNFGGVVKNVCLAYLPQIGIDEYAIVHAGFAISADDEESAQKTLRLFDEIGVLEEQLRELSETTDETPD